MPYKRITTLAFHDGGVTENGKSAWVVFKQDGGSVEIDNHVFPTGEDLGRFDTFAEAHAAYPSAFWLPSVLGVFVNGDGRDKSQLAEVGLTAEDYKTFQSRSEARAALKKERRRLAAEWDYTIVR